METWKILTIVFAVATVAASLFTASALAMMYPIMHGVNTTGYYGSMMSGYKYNGMMNGYTHNSQETDCGNHGQITSGTTYGTNPLDINQSLTNAQNYVANLNNPDLAVKQVEEHTDNFYVQVIEKSTGNGAFELVVDKYTSTVYPEMGPNIMWNTKYTTQTNGMMNGGMMGGVNGMMSGLSAIVPTTSMPVTVEQAKTDAKQYLNPNYPATTVGEGTTFYGYYTFEANSNGTGYGMLSVNGYTGQVWYHTWHGNFVQELDMS
jgi:hypothetical protein